jgi:hypothetical protein
MTQFFFWMNQILYNQTKRQHTLSQQNTRKYKTTHSSYKHQQGQQQAELAEKRSKQ